jgi:hypothetical protein
MLFTRALFRRLKGLDYFDQILKFEPNVRRLADMSPTSQIKRGKFRLTFLKNVAEKGFAPNVRRLADMSPTSQIKRGKFRLTFLKNVAEKGFEPNVRRLADMSPTSCPKK